MTIDELKAAIERRGFLIRLWLPEEDAVKMIVMFGNRSMPYEISHEMLAHVKLDANSLIESAFGSLVTIE